MVDALYPLVAFVTTAVFGVLYFYATGNVKDEYQTEQLKKLFRFCALFCGIDTVWGMVASGYYTRNVVAFHISSIVFLIGSATIIYEWFTNFLNYSKVNITRTRKIIFVIPLFLECILALSNPFTGIVFKIDANKWIYMPEIGQRTIYIIHILYLMAVIHVATKRLIFSNDRFLKGRYKAVISCVAMLIVCCALQDVLPKAPMMSLGCMLAAIIALIRISVVDDKKHMEETTEQYQNSARDIYSAFEAMAKSYVSIHLFDLRTDKQHPVKSTPVIDSFTVQGVPASIQIKNVMKNIVHEDYRDSMVEFVDTSTLTERLKDKSIIIHEFLGLDHGWCVASFIKVEEDSNGNVIRAIHAVQNINEIKVKEIEYERAIKEALENQNVIYEEMLKAQTNGVIAINGEDEIINLNDAAAKLLGYSDANRVPRTAKIIFDNVEFDEEEEFVNNLRIFKERGKAFEYSFSINRGSEKTYIAAVAKRFKLKSGEQISILSLSDITKNKQTESKLKALSETDALTGIDNRRSGEQKIISMMEGNVSGMLCIIDVNKFKGINDSYGHHAGDIVLQSVAGCIRQSFRDTDVVMRLGGDEFAVYAKELLNQGVCAKCMEGLFTRINEIDIPECKGYKPSISVGIAFYDGKNDCTYNRLYQQADSVMYMSKNKGGNCYTVFKKLRG